MRIWFALLVAPMLALADQSLSLAAADWACSRQQPLAVHAVHVLFLVPVTASIFPAWRLWRAPAIPTTARDHAAAETRFLAGIAAGSAVLSATAIVAMWLTAWLIAPCYN